VMPNNPKQPEVTDADREAAADIWRDFVARPGECIVEKQLRSGSMDDSALVQTIRNVRIAAERATERRVLEEAAQWLLDDGTRLDYDAEPLPKEHPFWWAADRIRAMKEEPK